jgi:diguanylate cyclase (GGDEF)-like protein
MPGAGYAPVVEQLAVDQREIPVSQPDIGLLLQCLPLPIVLLTPDGTVLGMSVLFEQTYGAQALQSAGLRARLQNPSPHWESVEVAMRGGGQRKVDVYFIPFRDDVLALFAEPGAAIEDTPKVADLESRVIELERLVATDALTGAWNRAHLDRIMSIEMSRSARHRQPLSVILLDIDSFKEVNDTHGHAAGDAVLRKLVQILQQAVRPGDMLFRWGGEEFLVLVPSTPYPHARVVAEKLRTSIEGSDFGTAGKVTISLGVAERHSGESADALFERVDKALYTAKGCGRNCTIVDQGGCSDAWSTSVHTARCSEARGRCASSRTTAC